MQKKDNDQKAVHDWNQVETQELCQMLETAFEATFVDELIPGILHNFANPLNGIMGRAQILQRRLNDTLTKIGEQYPDVAEAFMEPHKKLVSDVAAICQESDRFYNMFQDVSGKFYAIGAAAPERIDITRLLSAELRFADYYIDFKHEARKELDLEESLPEIYGIASYYSLCFWSLFRNAMALIKAVPDKTLYISTSQEDARVVVRLRYQGLPLDEEESRMIEQAISGEDVRPAAAGGPVASHFHLSLYLLRRLGAQVDFQSQEGAYEIAIRIPY